MSFVHFQAGFGVCKLAAGYWPPQGSRFEPTSEQMCAQLKEASDWGAQIILGDLNLPLDDVRGVEPTEFLQERAIHRLAHSHGTSLRGHGDSQPDVTFMNEHLFAHARSLLLPPGSSDHLPILTTLQAGTYKQPLKRPRKWRLRKVSFAEYQQALCKSFPSIDDWKAETNPKTLYKHFEGLVMKCAH
eukprot:1593981-Amphidinium_carterae.1